MEARRVNESCKVEARNIDYAPQGEREEEGCCLGGDMVDSGLLVGCQA